jgi:hypothetical protein
VAVDASTLRGSRIAVLLLAAALAYLTVATVSPAPPLGLPVATALCLAAFAVARPALSWRSSLVALVLVILLVPIRRYAMPGDLPFEIEPYRLFLLLLMSAWGASLLADPAVRVQRSGFEGPMLLLVVTAVLSEASNPGRAAGLQSEVIKALTFFIGFVLVFYLIVGVVRSDRDLHVLLKALVGGGAAVAVLAVFEARSGVNLFNELPIPLDPRFSLFSAGSRGEAVRAYASAQHPIALSAMLVMLIPLALYLGQRAGQRRWWFAGALLTLGALSTLSRTGVIMLVGVGLGYLWLRRAETVRFWPLLVPLLVAVHVALPGTIGTLRAAFTPEQGLIAEQEGNADFGCGAQGRVAKIGPTFAEVAQKPAFGIGYGTRITDGPDPNACVLDDQWLSTALETGLVGLFAWAWLFARYLRRLGAAAKDDRSERGWLLTALCASSIAFMLGMLTFDAFSFIQVTFVLFILLALGAVAMRDRETRDGGAATRAAAGGGAGRRVRRDPAPSALA